MEIQITLAMDCHAMKFEQIAQLCKSGQYVKKSEPFANPS